MAFLDILPTTPAPVIAGANEVTRTERLPSFANGRETMRETWEGPRTAVLAKYDALKNTGGIESLNLRQAAGGGALALTVEWRSAGGETDSGTENDATWNIEKLEIPAALATHPYFQVPYFPASGTLFDELMARADHAVASGQTKPTLGVDQSGYQTYLDRYWGHVLAGVSEYPRLGVQLTKEARVLDLGTILAYNQFCGRVRTIAQLGAPANITAMLSAFTRISGYGTEDPDTAEFAATKFEFLQLFPTIAGPVLGPWDVTMTWWGVDRWSRVLYPGGTWDPGEEDAWPE